MPGGPAVPRQNHWSDARDLAEVLAQVIGIRAADRGFLHELIELLRENDRLRLRHAEVAPSREAAIALVGPACAAAVVVGVALVDEFLAHAGDGAAFAGRNVFGFLEAEAAE